ncbi:MULTISPECIES: LpxA family transferase [Flavobacteriaceae]|uniref:LpxA family transferase n=1 Tax=Flavobacteriaceae TaxID=49546 RepID=UPI0023499199|nr:LpxA family transferase [Muricauda sp. SP22]MDC6364332.1 LpxA family transferase [Muricauda sp. SP22]
MIDIRDFIADIPFYDRLKIFASPWEITTNLKEIILDILPLLGSDFKIEKDVAIHKSVVVEKGVTFKNPTIIMENCHVGAHAYFREGVFLDRSVKIGPSTEVKSSLVFSNTAIAHLNYIGNSIIGSNVNFEAGSIAANHYNERTNKEIVLNFDGEIIPTGVNKFGALVGDNSRIGANAVLSPGTLLKKNTIVKRLELVEQHPL